MGVQVFSAITEFKFDIAQALAGSDTLQKSTKKMEVAIDGATAAVERFGINYLAAMGVTGVLGILEKALKISDAFNTSVLDMTGALTANFLSLDENASAFNARLAISKTMMSDIAGISDRLDLNSSDVFSMVKTLIPAAAQSNNDTSTKDLVSISGSATSAASGIGMSPSDMATAVATFFTSTVAAGPLLSGLQANGAFTGMSANKINAMDDEEIFKILKKGLENLNATMGDTAARSELLSFQIGKLKRTIFGAEGGMGSMLKPLSDAILPLLVGILKEVNGYLKSAGGDIVKSFSQILKHFVSTPRAMLTSVLQLRQVHSDLNKAAGTLGVVSSVQAIGFILARIANVAVFANPIMGVLAFQFTAFADILSRMNDPISKMIGSILKWVPIVAVISGVLARFGLLWSGLAFVMAEVVAPLALLMLWFQAVSRAVAKAHIEDALHMAEILPKIMQIFTRFTTAIKSILLPVELAIEGISEFLKPLFKVSIFLDAMMPLLEGLASVLEFLGNIIMETLAGISGYMAMFLQVALNLQEGITHIFDNLGKAFSEGYGDFLNAHKQKLDDGKNVQNMVTNISKVEIRNDFKEQMEPDRIAFALKDQLMKTAQNPTSRKGASLQALTATR